MTNDIKARLDDLRQSAADYAALGWLAVADNFKFIIDLTERQDAELIRLRAANKLLRRACRATLAAYESHQLYDKCPVDLIKKALDA